MKIKIPDIVNDYLVDIIKYYRKFRKILRKIYRKFKYHWNNPKSKIGKKFVLFINHIFEIIISLKNLLLNSDYKKRNLIFISAFIIINLLFLVLLPSFAIYQNQFEFSVLGGVVGDKYANQFDYSLLIYIEEANDSGVGNGTYILTNEVPSLGYTYSGYKCKNNSNLLFDEETNYTSVTLEQKDVCSIYFNLTSSTDISLKIMLEDGVNSNTYSLSNSIPYYGYKYTHYECNNNSILNYDSSLHKAKIEAGNKDLCSLYFKKEQSDLEVNLYIENISGNYKESATIPSGNSYVLNEINSECTNNNNERIETEISYINGYIEVTTTEVAYCNVYLDLENE